MVEIEWSFPPCRSLWVFLLQLWQPQQSQETPPHPSVTLETFWGLKYGSKYIWVTENLFHQCRFPSAQRFLPSSHTCFSISFKPLTQFLSASCDAIGSQRRCIVRHSSHGAWLPAIGTPLHEDLRC